MSETPDPPYFQISQENHSPWVVVTSLTFLAYSIMAVTAKIVSRLHLSTMKSYDWVIVTATTIAFVQTVCVVGASKNGLGRPQDLLSSDTVHSFSKFTYAASILFVISMFFSKISVIFFIMAITPSKPVHLFCYLLSAIIGGWAITGVFGLAFQCDLPSPYLAVDNECIHRFRLQLFIGIVNLLTDLALVVLPAVIMKRVQTSTTRKWQVVGLFATRLLVPAFTIPQLVAYHKYYDSNDETWDAVSPALWSQLVMNLSILTACMPSLKGVLDMLKSGTSLFTVPAQYENTFGSSSHGKSGTGLARTLGIRSMLKRSDNRSGNDTKATSGEWPTQQMKKITGQHSADVSSTGKDVGSLKRILERSESQKSLTENVIMRTVNFEVGFEEMKPHNGQGRDHQSGSSIDIEERDVETSIK